MARGVSASEARPTTRSTSVRLVGLDVARCLALLGMVATHVLDERTADGGLTLTQWVAGGRASALFAVLAGVSLALVSGRRTPMVGGDRLRVSAGLLVRALLVAVVGLALGGLDTSIAIILTYYAVLFVLGLPFLGLTARPLLLLAGAWALLAPVVSHLVRPELPDRQFASPALDQLVSAPGGLLSELLFTGYYPAFGWLAYLLLGMGIGRLDLSRRTTQARLLALGLFAAVVAKLASDALTGAAGFAPGRLREIETGMSGQTPTDDWSWLLVAAPHSTTTLDLVRTGGSAVLVLGACLLVVGMLDRTGQRVAQVVFGAGAMTLSLYALHVVMRTPDVWPDEEPSSYVWHVVVLLWVGGVFAALGRRGPLEWVVGLVPRALRPGRPARTSS